MERKNILEIFPVERFFIEKIKLIGKIKLINIKKIKGKNERET